MIAWARLSLAGAGIVAGGVGLGAMLAAFVSPVPTEAPAPPWANLPQTRIAAPSPDDGDSDYARYWPRDLTPSRDLQTAVALLDAEWPIVEADSAPRAADLPEANEQADYADPVAAEPAPEAEPAPPIVAPDLSVPPAPPVGRAKTIHVPAAEG